MIPAARIDAADDGLYMSRALELAARGLYTTDPNPRVGCVLVRDGQVLGEGWHERAGEPHAEVLALRAAAGEVRGATAYVTLEPCSHTGRTPPCADALIAAGIGRVVCATTDPNPKVSGSGLQRLRAAGIAVELGLHESAARELNIGFMSRFERGRPYVRLKMAMSLDARTAPAGGGQRWISGAAARADVQVWRARSSAVLTGAGTVRVDDPRLDVRLDYGSWIRQPLRVVLDPQRSCPPGARVFAAGPALILAAPHAARDGVPPGVEIATLPLATDGLDLSAVLELLAQRQINELLVECGARLAASFLRAGLVDELILYVAPLWLGADAAPLASLDARSAALLARYEFRDQRLIDEDLRLILTPKKA
jgi:diaminohydroxyphosphoribosylaminopyrimidine deaminase/5-amino-6-(5-phosphoribosylamino)uracil reductase